MRNCNRNRCHRCIIRTLVSAPQDTVESRALRSVCAIVDRTCNRAISANGIHADERTARVRPKSTHLLGRSPKRSASAVASSSSKLLKYDYRPDLQKRMLRDKDTERVSRKVRCSVGAACRQSRIRVNAGQIHSKMFSRSTTQADPGRLRTSFIGRSQKAGNHPGAASILAARSVPLSVEVPVLET